jgi:hypothetical protein
MPFLASCPFCRRKVQAPEAALGQSIACKKCHNYFTLAPEDDLPPPEATARNAQEYLLAAKANALNPPGQAGPSSPVSTPASEKSGVHVDTVVHASTKTIPETPRLLQTAPPLDEPDAAGEINLLTATPLVLGVIAMLCAALAWRPALTIGLGSLGILAGVIAWLAARINSHRDGLLVFLGSVLSVVALVWALM